MGGGAWPTGFPALRVACKTGVRIRERERERREKGTHLDVPDGLRAICSIGLAHARRKDALPRGRKASRIPRVLARSKVLPRLVVPAHARLGVSLASRTRNPSPTHRTPYISISCCPFPFDPVGNPIVIELSLALLPNLGLPGPACETAPYGPSRIPISSLSIAASVAAARAERFDEPRGARVGAGGARAEGSKAAMGA